MGVKWYTSAMPSAPVLTGLAGSLVAVLDACLVTGFGSRTLTSLSVTSEVATATIGAGHTYQQHSIVKIEGATPTELNGEKRILSVTGTQFTFAAADVEDGSASGTITASMPPGGWDKVYSATNKAVYRPQDLVAATGILTRVDDTGTRPTEAGRVALLRGYEAMSDIDTGTGLIPTAAQDAAGPRLLKSDTASSAGRAWFVATDGLSVILWTATYGVNQTIGALHLFGDAMTYKLSGDAYCWVVQAGVGSVTSLQPGYTYGQAHGSSYSTGRWIARSHTGLGSPIAFYDLPDLGLASESLRGIGLAIYPAPIDGGLLITAYRIMTATEDGPRGELPGLWAPCHTAASITGVANFAVFSQFQGLPDRNLMWLKLAGTANQFTGACMVDLAGPWR